MNKFLFGLWVFCYSVLALAQTSNTTTQSNSVSFSGGSVSAIGFSTVNKPCMADLSVSDIVDLRDVVAIQRDTIDSRIVRVYIAGFRSASNERSSGDSFITVVTDNRERYIRNILRDKQNCR